MGRSATKAERIEQMIWMYSQRAYTDIEMAEALGVERSTIWRDRTEMALTNHLYEETPGRWRIDRDQYISNIKVNLHEGLALYLAARRASRQTRIAQPHVARGLEKLAAALRQPMTERLASAAARILEAAAQPERVHIVEQVAQGWAEHRKVAITYTGLHARRPNDYLISPYLIEPSMWSDGAYVIGPAEGGPFAGKASTSPSILTFKIERIEAARATLQSFAIPNDFDEDELLRYAWGIWTAGAQPVTVRLRFAPGEAARRVRESIWHPTQKLEELEDGGCIWTAQVAEWHEMLPWVRGWGAEVEVLEPERMRTAVVQGVRKLAGRYGLVTETPPEPYHTLWAKADGKRLHRLIYHLIDVGQMALALWEHVLPGRLKIDLSKKLGLPETEAGRLLAFWAALHDLGKASPGFQFKLSTKQPGVIEDLRLQGFAFPNHLEQPARHEVLTIYALDYEGENLLVQGTGLEDNWARKVAQALGGHHGAWVVWNKVRELPPSEQGGEEWRTARLALFRDVQSVFAPPACHLSLSDEAGNALLTIFSGFVTLADWLGSDDSQFDFQADRMPIDDYVRLSAKRALAALHTYGWVAERGEAKPFDFQRLFGLEQASQLQAAVIENAGATSRPVLAIIEAPTGHGKTEAALSLYALWTQAEERPGLYIAMPTTATSDQMHARVTDFLSRCYCVEIMPLLVHSKAALRTSDVIEADDDRVNEDLAARQVWFLPRKRSLLAPFGVGTVDQTFMSVLQTRHFFLRLLGLSGKVVIFDEVHAYDAYMSKIFHRLLAWLRSVGASVILLSATLPEAARQEFVEAFTGAETELPAIPYPRLTLADLQGAQVLPLPQDTPGPALEVASTERDLPTVIKWARQALNEGGCAAIICNTVGRAQLVYQAIQNANQAEPFCPMENLFLFHARTRQEWRDETQAFILDALGKEARRQGRRPERMLVVATQVIEQSLDLDFDAMLTDLAPLDLLVQRAGRLQRHPPRPRPQPYRLYIAAPDIVGDLPVFPRKDYPYDEHLLLRTWAVLRDYKAITLSNDAPRLIEEVYGPAMPPGLSPTQAAAFKKAQNECNKDRAAAQREAGGALVKDPGYPSLLALPNADLVEDDHPQARRYLVAHTRRDAPGVSLVCLFRVDGQVCFDPQGLEPVNLERPLPGEVKRLARCAIAVQSPSVVRALSELEPPIRWKKIAALRHLRLAIFDNDRYAGPSFCLHLTRALGLQIEYGKPGDQDDDI